MYDSILRAFFEAQHKKLNQRAYTYIHFTCKNSPIPSDYGAYLRHKTLDPPEDPDRAFLSHKDLEEKHTTKRD